ncbi:MAG: hypothetical protein JNK61_00035 [Bacteroidia bacterium]|nr:hypothetical protein [Bacteroidia bacterium]HQV00041.1 hypothetical protein [Bacteroidia bacterium]
MQNLKLLAIAIIAFIVGFFACKNFFCKQRDDKAQIPQYFPVKQIFNDYQTGMARNSNFAGLEFTKEDLTELANSSLTDTVQMIIAIDKGRNKVVYFRGVYDTAKPSGEDTVYYFANNQMQKITPTQLTIQFYAQSHSLLKDVFESVFTTAAAAKLPRCPPYNDPRCSAVQAATLDPINGSGEVEPIL